jgi:hypothetical protein
MGHNNRYDRPRPVSGYEEAEARAPYAIADLVGEYPGITNPDVAGQVAHVLYATSGELRTGRAVPIEIRRAVRGLANALRREMDPRDGRR